MEKPYQSWTNRATWAVNKFLSYSPEYDHWANVLEDMADWAPENQSGAIEELADLMCARMVRGAPELEEVWGELMDFALIEAVDWAQIAHRFVTSRFGAEGE